MLKEKGDALNKELKSTETELRALENTIALLEGSNQMQKHVFKRASSGGLLTDFVSVYSNYLRDCQLTFLYIFNNSSIVA